MPYINLQITKGASREQKKALVSDFTESLVKHLGKSPEHIHIVIDEIEEENWGIQVCSQMNFANFRKKNNKT